MDKKIKNPVVRFKGFTEDWVERKFEEDIISIQTGTNLLGNTNNKGIPLIKMGNIQRGYFSFNKIEYLDKNIEVEKENIVNYGDFLFNTRNTLELVGKGATWTGESGKFAFNNNIARFVFKDIDTIFFNYFYNTKNMISEVQARAMGTTSVAAVYPKSLNSLKYILPSNIEQKQIGTFFQNLDNLITLHQKKYDKLVILKKAMLVKMFPKKGALVPEIRFKGFTADWEEMRLGDFAQIKRGLTYSPIDVANKGVKVLRSSNIFEDTFIQKEDDVYVNDNAINIEFAQQNDILITSANGSSRLVGKHAILKNLNIKAVHGGFMLIARTKYPYFLNASMSSPWYRKFINMNIAGGNGAIGNLKSSDLEEHDILIPNEDEQQKIGKYFQNLDNQIDLHKTQLDKLNTIKKACFSKMFVAQD